MNKINKGKKSLFILSCSISADYAQTDVFSYKTKQMEYHRMSNTHIDPNKNTNYTKKYMKLHFKMHSIIVSFTCLSLLGFEWSNGKRK